MISFVLFHQVSQPSMNFNNIRIGRLKCIFKKTIFAPHDMGDNAADTSTSNSVEKRHLL